MLKQNVDTHVPNNAVHLKPFGESYHYYYKAHNYMYIIPD